MKPTCVTLTLLLLASLASGATGFMLGGANARPHALMDTKAHSVLGTYDDAKTCKAAMLAHIKAQGTPPTLGSFYRFQCEPAK